LTSSQQFQQLNKVSAPHTFLLSGAGFIQPKADTICSFYTVNDNKQVIVECDLTHPKKKKVSASDPRKRVKNQLLLLSYLQREPQVSSSDVAV